MIFGTMTLWCSAPALSARFTYAAAPSEPGTDPGAIRCLLGLSAPAGSCSLVSLSPRWSRWDGGFRPPGIDRPEGGLCCLVVR
jgi:hypothetical protein